MSGNDEKIETVDCVKCNKGVAKKNICRTCYLVFGIAVCKSCHSTGDFLAMES